jgi:DnaJ-class molecular chaperone
MVTKKEVVKCYGCSGYGDNTHEERENGHVIDSWTKTCSKYEGSGKLLSIRNSTDKICEKCDGAGKCYYPKNTRVPTPGHFGGFKSKEEERDWNDKHYNYRTCEKCEGCGKEFGLVNYKTI